MKQPTRRQLNAAAALSVCALLPSQAAKADSPVMQAIQLGRHAFSIPAPYLHSYDATGLSVAALWPDMTGAIGTKQSPRTVLEIGISLRRPPLSVAEDGQHSFAWRPAPHDANAAYGLFQMSSPRRAPAEIFLVDDPANPTLFVRYPTTMADPTDNWIALAFDIDDLRAHVSFFGTLLPQWRDIRARVLMLYVSFLTTPAPPSAP